MDLKLKKKLKKKPKLKPPAAARIAKQGSKFFFF